MYSFLSKFKSGLDVTKVPVIARGVVSALINILAWKSSASINYILGTIEVNPRMHLTSTKTSQLIGFLFDRDPPMPKSARSGEQDI